MAVVYCQESEGEAVYYVTATGNDCPPHTQCHSIHYYANLSDWAIDSITLIFLPGEHMLEGFSIKGLSLVVLKGSRSANYGNRSATIKCKNIFIADVLSLSIDNLNFNHIEYSRIHFHYVSNAIISQSSAQLLNINQGHYLTILQSEFIVDYGLGDGVSRSNIFLDSRRAVIVMNETLISRVNGNCLWLFVDFCLEIKAINSHMTCSNGLYILATTSCQADTGIIFNNVTIDNSMQIPRYLYEAQVIITYNGNVSLTDVRLVNVGQLHVGLTSVKGGTLSLTRVSITGSASGLKINKCGNEVNLFDVSVTGTNSIGFCISNCNSEGSINLTRVYISQNHGSGLELYNVQRQVFIDNCTISNNNNSGLYASGNTELVFVGRPSTIANNKSPANGGGIWINENARIMLYTRIKFINNTAKGFGGAIYIAHNRIAPPYPLTVNCTISNFYSSSNESYFQNNFGGLSGNDIYGGLYWDCFYYPYLNSDSSIIVRSNTRKFDLKCDDISLLTSFSSHITTDPVSVCMCSNENTTNCSNRIINRVIYPGQSVSLLLATIGVCGGISLGELVTSGSSGIDVSLGDTNQQTEGKWCKKFTYKIHPNHNSKGGEISLSHKAYSGESILTGSDLKINITFLLCPHGLVLSSGTCQCNSALESIKGTQCSIDWLPHPIKRSRNNWLSYHEQYNCTLAHANCPFDYCNTSTVYLNLTHPDLQCTNGRSGTLCGKCKPGLSLMLGSNNCQSCDNKYLSLLIPFILGGLALVVFLLVCNLTVSVGSINGLLFYANIIKLNEAAFLPNGFSIPVLSQFIAWLNLDLGIQTCFFNGLDGYWKTWLQFGFSLTLIAAIITCCKFSSKLSHMFGRNVVAVLSTLIFMAHSKLLLAIRNALMLAVLKCGDKQWYVWSIDANIGYLSTIHLPLFIFSLTVMFIGFVYTMGIFSSQWMTKFCGKHCRSSWDPFYRFKPFIDSYTGPYNDKYRYWTGLLLLVRLLLTAIFSYSTGIVPLINTGSYIIALVAFILMVFSRGVYRTKGINLLEYFYLFNLGLLSLLNGLSGHMELDYYVTSMITAGSISLSLLAFIATVIAHIIVKMKKARSCSSTHHSNENNRVLSHQNSLNNEEMYSPANIVNRRESLIYEF